MEWHGWGAAAEDTNEMILEGLDGFFSLFCISVPWGELVHRAAFAVLSQSFIGLRAAISLVLPAHRCYQSSRD